MAENAFGQFTPQPLPFSQNWTNTGLITANDMWGSVPGIEGRRGDGLTTMDGVNPQTVTAADDPGVVDVNANQTNPNTFTTGGVTEFEITNPVVALAGSTTADAPYLIIRLNTTGQTSINVRYRLRDIDGSTDDAVQPVALQYRVGASGVFTNVPTAYVADASAGPSSATLVSDINVTLPAAADNQAEIQLRIITANAMGSDEWIGIDDISVTGTPIVSGPASFSAIADCDNATSGVGTAAAVNGQYIHISNISGFGASAINFTLGSTAVGSITGTSGTLGPIDVSTLLGTVAVLTATQGSTTANVELPIVVCGYPQNAQHCSPSVGILAQNPPVAQNSGNNINSTNVYVLVRGGNVVAVNNTGLFQSLINLQAHTIHSFTVLDTDLAAFTAQFTVGAAYTAPGGTATCFANCWSTTITPDCCTAYTTFNFTNTDPSCIVPGGIIPQLSGSQTGVNYQLQRDGSGNVDSPVAGTGNAITFPAQTTAGTYIVIATASPLLSGCTSTQMATLTLNPPPAFTLSQKVAPACPNNQATIEFGTFPATGTYEFSFTTGGTGYNTGSTAPQATPTAFAAAMASTTITGAAPATTYWVRLRNTATGCTNDQSVTTGAPDPSCCDAEAGTLSPSTAVVACEGATTLNVTVSAVAQQAGTAYGYVFVLVQPDGNVRTVNTTGMFDLSTENVTVQQIFKVYGLSYLLTDLASIPGVSTAIGDLVGDPFAAVIADASQAPAGTQFCGEVSAPLDIIINPVPVLTNQTPILCSTNAGSVDLDDYETAIGIPTPLPGGATVVWYAGDGTGGTNLGADPAPQTVTNGAVFTVVYTNSQGCPATAKVTFTVNNVACRNFPWNGQN